MFDEEKSCVPSKERAQAIAELNDSLRKDGRGGVIVVTRSVRGLPQFTVPALLAELAAYDAFDEDNNPYGERDFGDIDLGSQSLLWKIDYYDNAMLYGSPDPADAAVTQRVLTVMLPEEW